MAHSASEPGSPPGTRASVSPLPGSSQWLMRRLRLALAVFAIAVLSGGWLYYDGDATRITQARHRDIAAIADAKVTLIQRWREERGFDARRMAVSDVVRVALEVPVLDAEHVEVRGRLLDRLRIEREVGEYAEAYLLDPSGKLVVSASGPPDLDNRFVRSAIARTRESADTAFSEPRLMQDGSVRIDTVLCVCLAPGSPNGFVGLSSSVGTGLFADIQKWPTPSETGEAFIFRQDGPDVLYMSPLKFRPGESFIRRPMTETWLPTVQAINGYSGEFRGRDYRGVDVVADLRPVPRTTWFVQTKVDTVEVLAEVRFRAIAVTIVVAGLLVTGTAASAYGYRSRQSSERAAANELVRQSETRLIEAQRIAVLGHYELEVAVGRWSSSAALDEIFGIASGFTRDVTGWISLIHHDDRDEMATYLSEFVLGQGHAFDREYRIVRADTGAVRWVHGRGALQYGPDGQLSRMFGTIQDVTERKQLEDDLRERNAELTRFVYTVSHDLKSPLVTIQTFLGFLDEDLKRDDPSRVTKDMGFMRRAADRMGQLLNDLLHLSRVGRVTNPPEAVPLREVVDAALEMVAGRIAQRGVVITVSDEGAVLMGDRPRLTELFENLIDNAVKFMGDQPAPAVHVGVERADDHAVYFVRDNGVGIDPRHESKLFGLFEKLHPDSEGTGIGLALVKRIVEVHGGRIWVHSDGPGCGSTFRFTIPGPPGPPTPKENSQS